MKLKTLLIILGILIIFATIFYIGYLTKKRAARQNDEKNQEYLQIEKSNEVYVKEMEPLCNRQVIDITGVEFFRCKTIIDNDGYYLWGELRKELEKPDLSVFCDRKIAELKTNEFIECLEEREKSQ